ncbi:glycolipid 2-alpha-mannosyltransferase-domain-containing protein [Fimicolochytrium jonesii]|uniref:glycolipid 2-alpha-mannosyltransferase-domain-containing protein n=1 Tax=Fimicolochytrium jonesii TaxID=1396493 RepID=UPI0022FED409|nr:glycolipid 2-alpha-mannosyltransferase-domain-containing protein [Fimicolochytrium jonesii]KAI8818511.1 glycolipid 2-alpha-mannosyltransferase-domain-containing protein [Fimicolochytrium jonesii]
MARRKEKRTESSLYKARTPSLNDVTAQQPPIQNEERPAASKGFMRKDLARVIAEELHRWAQVVVYALPVLSIIITRNWDIINKTYQLWSSPLPPLSRLRGVFEEAPGTRANAAIVVLARNRDAGEVVHTLKTFEPTFNAKYRYPYVFLNDKDWEPQFKQTIADFLSEVRAVNISVNDTLYLRFGKVKEEHWSWPAHVDKTAALKDMRQMADLGVLHANKESYHHMCRFQSGFFFQHELLKDFKWYWRVEPDVDFFCPLHYDPFMFMESHNKTYGFNIVAPEFMATIPSLGKTVKAYMRERNITSIPPTLKLMWNETTDDYSGFHFWSNFEIGSLDWLRSREYGEFFEYLDATGNFFHERWGDAPVHSVAAGLLLRPDELHYFEDIGYRHADRIHCPIVKEKQGVYGPCECDVEELKRRRVQWGIWAYSDRWMNELKKWQRWAKAYQTPVNLEDKRQAALVGQASDPPPVLP